MKAIPLCYVKIHVITSPYKLSFCHKYDIRLLLGRLDENKIGPF